MNVSQLEKALPVLFEANVTPILVGLHGIGKSQIIKEYADKNGYGFVDLRLGQMSDSGDILGLPTITKELETTFAAPRMLPRSGKGILFLDELNRATKELLQAVFQLVYDRKVNEYTLPIEWEIVCAQNPDTDDYDVLTFEDNAFADRFCHIHFKPTVKEWLKYSKNTGVDDDIIGFIENHNELLESKCEEFRLNVKPSRRSWSTVDRIKKVIEGKKIPKSIYQELMIGIVGLEATSAYNSYIKDKYKTINPEDVLQRFPEFKDRIIEYGTNEANRTDILGHLNSNLLEYLKERAEKIEENGVDDIPNEFKINEEKNLRDYILCLPVGNAAGFTGKLMQELSNFLQNNERQRLEGIEFDDRTSFLNDEEILMYLRPDRYEEMKDEL